MVVAGRRKSIGVFIALGVVLITACLVLYAGYLFNFRNVAFFVLGLLLFLLLITGLVLNTVFLVREIRRNEQQDAFINAVTHELKTPVASIRLYLETLQSRNVDETKRQDFYRIMLEDSDRLLSTIEQVLRTGRIAPSSRRPNFSQINLSAVVADCVERARQVNRLTSESLSHNAGSPIIVRADMDELRAAVSNLVDNAVKYSGSDVRVTVETTIDDDKFVSVRVHDHGAGIPKTELKDIFKRFHRVPESAARVPGTGLGLYIVRSVAKRHGGKAWAESEGPGRGSTFVLQLPVPG